MTDTRVEASALVSRLLSDVHHAVLQSLDEIRARRSRVRWKSDDSPVTDADLLVQERLIGLAKKRLGPTVRIISEEREQDMYSSVAEYTVVIDPIDGTENFVSGLSEWGVSFGVWDATDQCLGAILLLPEMGLSLRSGQVVERLNSRIVGFSSSECDAMADMWSVPGQKRVIGCAVLNLFNVATGRYRAFLNPCGARVWDLLPGCVLALENSCTVLLDGEPYDGGLRPPDSFMTVEIYGPGVARPTEGLAGHD